MKQVNIHEAKTNLSKLIRLVEGGQVISIARNGDPVVEMTKSKPTKNKKRRKPIQFGGLEKYRKEIDELIKTDTSPAWQEFWDEDLWDPNK